MRPWRIILGKALQLTAREAGKECPSEKNDGHEERLGEGAVYPMGESVESTMSMCGATTTPGDVVDQDSRK